MSGETTKGFSDVTTETAPSMIEVLPPLDTLDANETIGCDASGLDPEFRQPTPIEGEA